MEPILLFPDPVPPEHRRMFGSLDIIGIHDDFFLVMCRQRKITKLREAGAEVIMLDPDANHYMGRVSPGGEQELLAFIDERRDKGREDLRIADRGRERDEELA